ncbi:MAG: hypothetical protein WA322_13870, partial [Pseudolabrys sp.]
DRQRQSLGPPRRHHDPRDLPARPKGIGRHGPRRSRWVFTHMANIDIAILTLLSSVRVVREARALPLVRVVRKARALPLVRGRPAMRGGSFRAGHRTPARARALPLVRVVRKARALPQVREN